jgi:hypothetical protein
LDINGPDDENCKKSRLNKKNAALKSNKIDLYGSAEKAWMRKTLKVHNAVPVKLCWQLLFHLKMPTR